VTLLSNINSCISFLEMKVVFGGLLDVEDSKQMAIMANQH